MNTAVTFIFYQYPSASKCPPVCRTVCRSNPLSSGVRVLWPGKFLVQVQGHVFRSFYQSVSGRWKCWLRDGLHFCSKEAWLTSCIYLLSVGCVVVNPSPRSPPPVTEHSPRRLGVSCSSLPGCAHLRSRVGVSFRRSCCGKCVSWWSGQSVCVDLLGQVYEAVHMSCLLLICGEGARTEGTWVSFLLGIERHVKIFWLCIFLIFSLWF